MLLGETVPETRRRTCCWAQRCLGMGDSQNLSDLHRPESSRPGKVGGGRSGGRGRLRQRLTCDIHVDGALFVVLVAVSAAEAAGVLGPGAAEPQKAAVLLFGPAAPLLHLHLVGRHACRQRP